VIQLLFDEASKKHHVYIRSGDDYELEGPYDTLVNAKIGFKDIFYNRFGISWAERSPPSGTWTLESRTFEPYEDDEEITEEVPVAEVEFLSKGADGIWRQTVKVFTTRKAKVDELAPIAKTSYVYFEDDEVYDSHLVDSKTGLCHAIQLLFDEATKKYHVYVRYGDNYKIEGSYDKIEDAKKGFKNTFLTWFGFSWAERSAAPSDAWRVEERTYETYEDE
jgi:hypothetical protein